MKFSATSSDSHLLNDITERIQKNFPQEDSADFTALHAIVLTWDQMKNADPTQGSNQFQVSSNLIFFVANFRTITFRDAYFS